MIELDVIDPTVNCNDCGKCCTHMVSPPFMVFVGDRSPQFVPYDECDAEECSRLLTAPFEAKLAFIDGVYSDRPDDSPCSWFDAETKRCKWHEFRPDICMGYPVGGESCLSQRMESC